MRLAAMTLIPAVFFGGLELGLRLFGFGYPASFFLPERIEGTDYFVTNERFGRRFFPAAQTRTPLFLRMRADKPVNCYRIFLFGGSAAWGDPDPTFGMGRYLKTLLEGRFPETEFDVVCVAMTAINSHAVLPIARECARHEGDLWVVYMGHNEMVGPFGAATVFGPQAPHTALVRTSLAVKTTRLGQLLDTLIESVGPTKHDGKAWGGLEMFRQHRLAFDDAARLQAYKNFQKNLEDVLRVGSAAGVPVVVGTMASNLKDCAPFASGYSTHLSDDRKAALQSLCRTAIGFEARGDYTEAIKQYTESTNLDAHVADVHFRLGNCYLAQSNYSAALREFELARDDDGLAFRADTRINRIIADTATRMERHGVTLVDAAGELARHSPSGIPGSEFFYEHVHLNFAGNYQLARVFAEKVASQLPTNIKANDRHNWLSAELCEQRLAVTVWDEYRLWQTNLRRLLRAPFTDQSDHGLQIKHYQTVIQTLEARLTSEALTEARQRYTAAVAASPEDFLLHANFAQFLEAQGDLSAALQEQERCRHLLPRVPVTYYKIGRIQLHQRDYTKATESISLAITLGEQTPAAHLDLALALEKSGKPKRAIAEFRAALRLDPANQVASQHLTQLERAR